MKTHKYCNDWNYEASDQPGRYQFSRRDVLALLGTGCMAPILGACSSEDRMPIPERVPDPLYFKSLIEVARMIQSKTISPVELAKTMLVRIETVDSRLKSFATLMTEHALAAAQTAEEEIQSGNYLGPLHGIPVAVKDLCFTRGVRTMGGHAVLSEFIPDYDSTVVSRLKAAGAVILGKLNTTEGAMGGYHRNFDIPINPWNADYWVGASSSGSGVATAAGLCFASIGTDTGGSIRFPSMSNGIVGLKPTYGLVSRYGVLPLAESLDHVGPMTRRVADAAIVLEAIAGSDPNDPTSLESEVPRMLSVIGRDIAGLRIGFDRRYATEGVDRGLVTAIEAALATLESLGAQIVEAEMPSTPAPLPEIWFPICAYEAYRAHRANFPSRADEYGEYFREFLEMGAAVSDSDYEDATRLREAFTDQFRAVLSKVDALASPSGGVPVRIEREIQYDNMSGFAAAMADIQMHFTIPADFAGTPAITLPCGFSDDGMPYSVQFMGDRLSEPTLCRIGSVYEEATEWHNRHPDV